MKRNPLLAVIITAAALGVLFFITLSVASFLAGTKRPAASLSVVGGGNVALVKIEGMLASSDAVVTEVNDYAEDGSIKAIVLRIDSPGGGVVPSQEIFNAVRNAKREGKKVVVSMGSVAASGGYYIAAAADKIVANPGTLTGSIGVKMEFASIEKLLEKIGIKGMVVKAGAYKDIGSPFREMTDAERKLLQDVIDDVHGQFIDAVAEGRGIPRGDVAALADGRIFTGRQALSYRLVDQLGDLDDSVQLAGRLAGIKGKPRIVEKKKKLPFLEYLKEESAAWISEVLVRGMNRESISLQYR
ncbi:MAG TPA: signal peptide peptidase SppA [Nitrospirota bacterium]|nr:signal peptide peptidase SppA [Nitrospirota bacterium]